MPCRRRRLRNCIHPLAKATLQASGGLDVLLQLAEKILRRNPRYVSILAPFTMTVRAEVPLAVAP